jgi:heme/copper-type cytochrome/quinol oxidase subunit 3
MIMGVIFIGGMAYEWREAFMHFPPSTGFGTVLFTLIGVPVTYVFTGVLTLIFVYLRMRNTTTVGENQWGVEGAAK